MNTKRKSRSNSARSPRARGNNERGISMDGVYNNSYFMNSVASLVGNSVKVHTMTGGIYEGIFRTFSAQFEIVVELAHKIDTSNPLFISMDSIVDKIIFRPHDIIKLEIPDTDLEFATRETFQTDTAISKFNGQVTEKELEPWDCPGNNVDDFDLDGTTANGWDVNDMFRQNEQMYGVTSNFDHGLSAYTTPLQNKDTKDYKDAEAKATKIANEIESNPHYKTRIDVENGDEEEKAAAVTRPLPLPTNVESGCNADGVNKYVCPPKRKTLQGSKVRGAMSGASISAAMTPAAVASTTSSVTSTSSTSPLSAGSGSTVGSGAGSCSGGGGGGGGGGVGGSGSSGGSTNVIAAGSPNIIGNAACTNTKSSTALSQTQLLTQSVVLLPSVHQETPAVPRTGRINGNTDSPKPQRTTTNTRHARGASRVSARTFGNSESARFSSGNGTHSHPSTVNTNANNSNHVIENRTQGNHHTNSNFNSNVANSENGQSGAHQHHRKPPVPLPHPVEHQNREQGSINQRKLSRGRDDQLTDLRKFGADFKLSDSEDSCKKQTVSNTENEPMHTPVNSVIDLQSQVPESQQASQHTPTCPAPPTVSQQQQQPHQQPQQQQQTPPPRPTTGHSPQESTTSNKIIKSKLNPNAKEFVYNPNAKPFTPRGASTPNQSRPHTPQTPGYGPSVGPAMPTAMVMPTYVVATSQQPYSQPPNQANRYRKVHMGMSQPSQMQVAAATGQPLLAPAPMHTQFTVPYSPQAHIAPQPYQQMVRMVAQQSSGIVPPVLTAINYPPENAAPAQMQYMGPGSMGPHPHHGHHPPHVHPQGNAPSPQSSNSQGCGGGNTGGGGSNQTGGGGGGGVNGVAYSGGGGGSGAQGQGGGYNQTAPPAPPHPGPTTFPIMCPILQPPPHPGPTPHHMIPAQTSVHQYIHHHHPHHHSSQMGNQQPHIQVILPHSQ
uniref:LsmAD domain-containing protein n=1 Tax=Triatoma infestans TaxID=30076 RepID=A0A023EZR3_TRIIF